MRIKLIVAQYPQPYPGAYMPNVIDAWDEFTLDDNYSGFEEALKKHEALVASGDYEAVKVLDLIVPDDAVTSLFVTPTARAIVVDDEVQGREANSSE